jgi:hypothetical protein
MPSSFPLPILSKVRCLTLPCALSAATMRKVVGAVRGFFCSGFSDIHGKRVSGKRKKARFIFICKALHWAFENMPSVITELFP